MISVIVPTIDGREHWLERCEQAYAETTVDYEFIVLRNYPTCGQAWNEGLRQAKGEWVHLSADDLEPHPGWWQAATEAVERGFLPCPRILNSDGSLQSCGSHAREVENGTHSDVARVPFFPASLVDALFPVFENQYMGDYWISAQALKAGWPTVVVREMLFTHHMAMEGRNRLFAEDVSDYRRALPVKFVITGGAGFLGSHLSFELEQHGHEVVVFDLKQLALARPALPRARGQLVHEHSDADVCIHLAAKVGRLFGEDDPMETITDNVGMTALVAQQCGIHGIRHGLRFHLRDLRRQRHRCLRRVRGAVLAAPQRVRDLQALRGGLRTTTLPRDLTILRFSMPYGPGLPAGEGQGCDHQHAPPGAAREEDPRPHRGRALLVLRARTRCERCGWR